MASIALVGMACRYADARTPQELWENVLAQRQAFRRLPAERLRLEEYYSADEDDPDRTYATEAAVIEGYEFDRVRFRVSGSTYRAADLAHWLALDVGAEALADAGFPEGQGLPRASTGVLLGNTLTGEFSRANVLRLRWPYVRRVTDAALATEGWTPGQRAAFLAGLEERYKDPFPPVGDETLAGGLSNTIAGRLCNHFDLHGGGYTVDGACASSLLAILNACMALEAGDLDVALAGGVDLSLDPFELVGFARLGALAREAMRVYDRRSAGFWPGEGCGIVVLMRAEDARTQGRRIYALIRGWGISSDGSGGITRPEVEGQLLALQRAYRRAGFGIDSVPFFEGHGTGTAVGDATELTALARARREGRAEGPTAVLGSIKANIGHTKAAAGVAGLIKAALALHTQVVPPTTGCEQPHPLLAGEAACLRVAPEGECWPRDQPLRAGVSAMGFGGINTHVVLEGKGGPRRPSCSNRERMLLTSGQDVELLLLRAGTAADLQQHVERLKGLAARLSRSEVADLAATLARDLADGSWRAALVASSPAELASRLTILAEWLADGVSTRLDSQAGVFLGTGSTPPRIGFLFPGQGSPVFRNGGAWERRFEIVRAFYCAARREFSSLAPRGRGVGGEGEGVGREARLLEEAGLLSPSPPTPLPRGAREDSSTAVAQPAIVTASLAGLLVLEQFGISATLAIGHSLGELTALHWAGALEEDAVLRVAAVRGQAMEVHGESGGAMASIGAGQDVVEELLAGTTAVIAGLNGPRQTVISGEAAAVASVAARAQTQRWSVVRLPVSRAFHSPLVAAAVPCLARQLDKERFQPLRQRIVSTVTGTWLAPEEDLREVLCRQITSPVRFLEALNRAKDDVDLWMEVGPGQVLCGLARDAGAKAVVALDAGGPSLKGLWQGVGAAFVLGAPVFPAALFAGRFTRPFDLERPLRFFVNPCELAPLAEGAALEGARHLPKSGLLSEEKSHAVPTIASMPKNGAVNETANGAAEKDVRLLVRRLVAERAELPVSAVNDDDHLLGELHLNSISVGQLVAEAARRVGLPPPVAPTDYARATVAEVARALEELAATRDTAPTIAEGRFPPGVDSWVRCFTVALVERSLPRHPASAGEGPWHVLASPGHPLAASLTEAFRSAGGRGVVVCLPRAADERHLSLLLEGARAVLQEPSPSCFVLVQQGKGGAALARTLHLENPEVAVCVVDVPLDHPRAAEWIKAEALGAAGYVEAHYDAVGCRREPVLRLLAEEPEETGPPLGTEDVVLVSGGGKGIAVEGALLLARETGARLVLLGRSSPEEDGELSANLARLEAAGVGFRYLAADVTDAEAVRAAVEAAERDFGPITALLHGAGTNVPQLLRSLEEPAARQTLAPKVQGFANLMAAVKPERLRLVIAFGSVIARVGLQGEADYALANDWLACQVERFQIEHPACRCLILEWSAWSGVGMAERLGRVDTLVRQGIMPIPPDVGVAWLQRLLWRRVPAVRVVVTGRLGDPPTLRLETPPLPFWRFLEQPRVYYPGVEIVADAEVTVDTDPYLEEHRFQGEHLLPAVVGLEALAQAAMAAAGTGERPAFANVVFQRPVVVPAGEAMTVRLAALVREPGRVEVVLRSSQTGFQVDHFRGMCDFGSNGQRNENLLPSFLEGEELEVKEREEPPLLPIEPGRDLYGGLLFQEGRFRRLRGYRRLRATECVAELTTAEENSWFGRYLPSTLVLGDPAVRDAAIHSLQACIPHAQVLPTGLDRLVPGAGTPLGPLLVQARERCRIDSTFIYDVRILGADGQVWEQWEGLRLRQIGAAPLPAAWPEPLLGPYVERRLGEFLPGLSVGVVVEPKTEEEGDSTPALQHVLGTALPIPRRPDGKPEVPGGDGMAVSAAHAEDLVLAVAGPAPLGCDLEPVMARPASVWDDLLGPDGSALAAVLVRERGEDGTVAATRVWAARECMTKAGVPVRTPLVLSAAADDWVVLGAGACRIATLATTVRGRAERLVLAVLAGRGHEGV